MTHTRLAAGSSFKNSPSAISSTLRPRRGRFICLSFSLGLLLGTASAFPSLDPTFGDYTYQVVGDSITIKSIAFSATGVADIPDTIEDKPVTAIGPSAFASRAGVTEVLMPSTVTSIGSYAFSGCTGLTGVSIPAATTTVANTAFYNCRNLIAINVDAANPSFESVDGVLFNETQTTLWIFPAGIKGGYAVPDGVLSIAQDAFNGSVNITGVTMPSSITSIGAGCFYQCYNLSTLSFLGDRPTVGSSALAFAGTQNGGLTIYYASAATGHTAENWGSYPLVPIPFPTTTSEDWLLSIGMPFNLDMEVDQNGDGVSLLMAYALNLDPALNLSTSMPQPVFEAGQMSLQFYAGRSDITYEVQGCPDLSNWTTIDSVSPLDENQNQTVSIPMSGGSMFMRLKVTPFSGPLPE